MQESKFQTAIENAFNAETIKKTFRYGSECLSIIHPFIEKPTLWNGTKAVMSLGKMFVDHLEIWPDTYFDSNWTQPYSHEFNDTILDVLQKYPSTTLRTADESKVIRIVEVDGAKIGWLYDVKLNMADEVYVEAHKLEATKKKISELLWEKFKNFSPFAIKDIQTSHNLVLKEMAVLGKLELSNFSFRDVVEQELVRDYLPNPKAILIVQGEAIGCLDLTKIKAEDIASKDDTLIIHLPDPELCSYRIDHSKSKIYDIEYAFMNEQSLMNEAYTRAEAKIKQSALEMGILEQTKKNAELVLKPLLENISGKKVVLQFEMKATLERLK
jgi:hypothetical protein